MFFNYNCYTLYTRKEDVMSCKHKWTFKGSNEIGTWWDCEHCGTTGLNKEDEVIQVEYDIDSILNFKAEGVCYTCGIITKNEKIGYKRFCSNYCLKQQYGV